MAKKKCRKRKHKTKEAAQRLARYLSMKNNAKMTAYPCSKCKNGIYHLTEVKELHFTEVITRKRKFNQQ